MKKLLFSLLSISLLLGLGGCQKEKIPEESPSLTDIVTTQFYLGVKAVNSESHGIYLSFDDKEAFKSVLDTFNESKFTFRDKWAQKIGFVSLDQIQRMSLEKPYQESNSVDLYPNENFASLLNPEGFIMVNNVLYQDVDNGNLVYIVHEDGAKEIYYEENQRTQSNRNSCNRGDDHNSQNAHRCAIGMYSYKITAHLDYWRNWITDFGYLYARSIQETGDCSTFQWSRAIGTLSFQGNYDLTINGNSVSGTINVSYGNQHTVRHEIARGYDLCINSVSVTHGGVSYTGKGASTTTSR